MQTIKNVGPLSLGKLMGIVYAALGLLFMPIFLIAGGLAIFQAQGSEKFGGVGILFLAVLFPICYGVMGFIGGIIVGFIYNLAAKFAGGIQVELAP